ncbi:enoyl-[acyl-carrier-protein] reductase FabK [Thermosyntropha sp.]|uniref:enoyl-[acyl-carrier-protein] reductase FabK n=1 Tax=Thermosyntropha sp. TaxID=2740820 RepID=UPI0025E4BF59|nr:enoyl-[acyl-carrier-protein] reductase FabK [Thermosyntropha sp.]MBO8158272.1 enoyl-[acyl-carrier-protein] reductase FabK [Thermosyntropha sp.]
MFENNRLCRLLNIKYPLFQGGMAWIAGGRLAAAVSNAGGLGIIGAGGAEASWLEEQIKLVKEKTDRPFGVNLMLALPNIEELIDVVVREKVPAVTTGAGNPGIYMEKFKEAGIKVIPVVASVALAKRLVRLGADAVIAEGMESGGHIGEMSTMCLVPMICDAVDVPVIAAGGVADGRGFMAAFALGAEGVQIGTRFICSEECEVHPAYQEKVLKARDRATVICGTVTNHPVRAIHNKFTRHYLQCEFSGMKKEELEELGRGKYPAAALNGDVEYGTILAGEIAGLINEIKPAGKIVEDIINHALRIKAMWGEL